MANVETELFEGANGAALTTSGSIFDQLVQGATYDTTIKLSGLSPASTSSGQFTSAGTAQTCTSNFTATNTLYLTFYLYLDALPAATMSLGQVKDSTGNMLAELRILTTGAVQIRNTGSTQVAISSTADGSGRTVSLATGKWCRVDWLYNNSTGKQQLRLFYDTAVFSTTPSYDSGLVTTTSAGTASRLSIGVLTATTCTFHMENLYVDNSTFTAPPVAGNSPPTANAGADQTNLEPGKTYTLNGSGSDTDGTIASYSWRLVSKTPSGAPTPTLSATNVAAPTVKIPGYSANVDYVYGLTVTDNGGATSPEDTVTLSALKSSLFVMSASKVWLPGYKEIF